MKWLRKVWIGLLSGVALFTSCTGGKPQPCVYGPPPIDPDDSIELSSKEQRRAELQARLDMLRDLIKERQFEEVYGPPEVIESHNRKTNSLIQEADSISRELEQL